MANSIIPYSDLKGELKKAFRNWVSLKDPELVSFPFKGKSVKGYVFDYEAYKYLVVTYLSGDTIVEDDDDDVDRDTDFDLDSAEIEEDDDY